MNRYLNILFILVLAIGLSSCAKEELENPSQMPSPQAIMKVGVDQNDKSLDVEKPQPEPLFINDDGDEEDEGLKPSIPIVIKN